MNEPIAEFRIRPARPRDVAGIQALLVDLGYARVPLDALRVALEEVLAQPNRLVLVAEDDGHAGLLGLASLTESMQLRLAARVVVIDELVVRDSVRGRGVGGLLLRTIRERAETLGAARIELHTNRARESYRRGFYSSQGFQEVDSAVMRLELRSKGTP